MTTITINESPEKMDNTNLKIERLERDEKDFIESLDSFKNFKKVANLIPKINIEKSYKQAMKDYENGDFIYLGGKV